MGMFMLDFFTQYDFYWSVQYSIIIDNMYNVYYNLKISLYQYDKQRNERAPQNCCHKSQLQRPSYTVVSVQ